jgi:cell division protein DivIC
MIKNFYTPVIKYFNLVKERVKNSIFYRNKYLGATTIFILWVVFFDSNSLIERFSQMQSIQKLEKDKIFYMNKIREDSKKLHELTTYPENLERFAREQFFMKKKNEDVFVIIEEGK